MEFRDRGPGPQGLLDLAQPVFAGGPDRPQQLLFVPRGSPVQVKELPFFSSDRMAFCSASGKDRPIAMTSPTDFMVVVRPESAPGNFSNANRGTLTTT